MLAFLFGLAGIVIYLALTGRLQLRGLLSGNGTPGLRLRGFSWARAQLLILSALALGCVLARWVGTWNPSPAFGIGATVALAVSQAVYLMSLRRQLESIL